MQTKMGIITTREYDDGMAKGIEVLLDNEIVCMLDVFEDGSEARVLVYAGEEDEPTECVTIK